MDFTFLELSLLGGLFFVIAVLYAGVGFGGGSSYLAILSLFLVDFYSIRSLALLCNLVVVGGSVYWYIKHGHFSLKKFMSFVVASVPLAFFGASIKLTEQVFFLLLSVVLIFSSLILIVQSLQHYKKIEQSKYFPVWFNSALGGGIGFLSGLVGIGGGIFLAPFLHHIKWGKALQISALAAFFILVNSLAGLSGLIVSSTFQLPYPLVLVLVVSVLLGGQLGVRLSLRWLSPHLLKILTALLVLWVGVRILIKNC